MKSNKKLFLLLFLLSGKLIYSQSSSNIIESNDSTLGIILLVIFIILPLFFFIFGLSSQIISKGKENIYWQNLGKENHFKTYLKNLNKNQIYQFMKLKNEKSSSGNATKGKSNIKLILLPIGLFSTTSIFAQDFAVEKESFFSQPGIIITIIILILPVLLGIIYALAKTYNAMVKNINNNKIEEAKEFAFDLQNSEDEKLMNELNKREKALNFNLSNNELSGTEISEDKIGVLHNISDKHQVHFTAVKKKAIQKPNLDKNISQLILWYFGCSVFWLVLGTGIGEYLGIKFVAPDVDHYSWLSFGRLRPVHTNIVFWGWASLAMIGLGYYVVPIVSNAKIYSVKLGWYALVLTNIMVILGSIFLMAGINNGGGEFREYIWPVMAFFAAALILTLINFILTVAKRTTKEIYIANWYIVSAIIFTIIVALTAYLPFWQDGVSETIVQGYFMHSGVGMWFTLYTLGLLYYFIPQQLNRPIYAYSLGILAFWTQIIFYTIIGTHHFVFAPLPWWLQTVAIVGSAGMIIPVVAATINFTMTFKGQWHKVTTSYTLPFFLVAVVYYFIVSMQGTAEAFKFTNLIWHFTDFTVAHAHLGFYGIITFALWGGFYVVIPRLTGKEPPQHLVGVHFWLAFIGLLFYTIPLSVGATLRGLMWMEGKPFIDSVVLMFDYWLWRAIGGSLMFVSHLVFAYNFYRMTRSETLLIDVQEEAFKILETQNK